MTSNNPSSAGSPDAGSLATDSPATASPRIESPAAGSPGTGPANESLATASPTTASAAVVTGPSFIALQVRNLEQAARFYEQQLGLPRAAGSPPGAVVFDSTPIPFAVREPLPTTDLTSGSPGLGVALWLAATDVEQLHERMVTDGVQILMPPFDGPFGKTFGFRDPEGYAVTVHEAAA